MRSEGSTWLRDLKLLLIDDDPLITDALLGFFQDEGVDAMARSSAEEGLQLLEEEVFDVIICDYRLPGMDGVEFFHRVTALSLPAGKVLVTAYGRFEGLDDLEVDAFLEKPFTAAGIKGTIQRVVGGRK